MNAHRKLRWYRFNVARRIRNLEGPELIQVLEEILEDIKTKKYVKFGIFRQFMTQIEDVILETKTKPKSKSREYDPFQIKRSGDGRIVLFGLSNVGKSTLMNAISNTQVKTGDYLHTTRTALGGTCEYESVKIQLIDVPGFIDYRADWRISTQILRIARTCDAILMVIDLSLDVLKQYAFLTSQLERAKILNKGLSPYKIGIVATKGDLPKSRLNFKILQKKTNFDIFPISSENPISLEQLKHYLFRLLEVIRIYTKAPHSKIDYSDPIICPEGVTIDEISRKIHKDLQKYFHFAKVWGDSVDFGGQHVGRSHELKDKDVVEIILNK